MSVSSKREILNEAVDGSRHQIVIQKSGEKSLATASDESINFEKRRCILM
eukprot:jgi/Bigna1/50572/estExt_Genewise1.C_830033